jgi:hypothetical protein
VFDPRQPRRRFTDIPRLKRIFTDVFSCHLEDMGFDTFNDTTLGLPLRDERMAPDSELSDWAVTLEAIDRLFARFRPPNMLQLSAVSELR